MSVKYQFELSVYTIKKFMLYTRGSQPEPYDYFRRPLNFGKSYENLKEP